MAFQQSLGSWSYFKVSATLLSLFAFFQSNSQAADGSLTNAYNLELAPLLGRNLPFDLWGTPGAMSAAGIRASAKPSDWDGAIEASAFYQSAGVDKAYSIEVAYRHEVYGEIFNGFFSVGYHFSKFDLQTDYDADGNCILENCGNDSGLHNGLSYGGGLLLPAGENNPIKLGIRYYQRPQTWVLLEMSYGVRF